MSDYRCATLYLYLLHAADSLIFELDVMVDGVVLLLGL